MPFDPGRLEARGAPVAVWSGLSARYTVEPGAFTLTGNAALFYRPGQAGGDRELALLDTAGELESWSPELRALNGPPARDRPQRRLPLFYLVAGREAHRLFPERQGRPGRDLRPGRRWRRGEADPQERVR